MAAGSVTFEYTGASQQFTVPAGVSQVFVQCWGAPGGTGTVLDVTSQNGVRGDIGPYAVSPLTDRPSVVGQLLGARSLVGYISGYLSVTPGHTYTVIVGGGGGYGNSNVIAGQGASTNGGPGGYGGGFFDGGAGGHWLQPAVFAAHASAGAGGGGGSGIIDGSAVQCVAGGGGGAADPISAAFGTTNATGISTRLNPTAPVPPFSIDVDYVSILGAYYGGPGGGSIAASGGSTVALSGGAGGSQVAPGSGGAKGASGAFSSSNPGSPGVGGKGGAGANNHTAALSTAPAGGGGGGGYFGGGGGSDDGSGGGGGSNGNPALLSHFVGYSAVNPQGPNGLVVISWSTQPPNTPIIIKPVANRVHNINASLTLEWAFSSNVSGAVQGSFDVEYQTSTGSAFTVVNVAGSASSYVLAASLWATGQTIQIGIRTYDQFGAVSSYALTTITTVTGPLAPTITAPATNGTITTSSFLISATWPSTPVGQYQGRILDAAGNIIFDSGRINNSRFNLCPNPNFAVDASSWAVSGGSIASSVTFHKTGTTSGKIIWPTANALSAYADFDFATLPGETYSVSCWVTVGNATTDPQPQLAVCNVGSESSPFAFAVTAPVGNSNGVAGTFVLTTVQFVAINTTTRVLILPAQNVTAGAVAYVGAVLCEETEVAATSFSQYFDGGSASGSWTGTAGKSTSKVTFSDPGSVTVGWVGPSQSGLTMQMRFSALSVGSQTMSEWASHTGVSVNLSPPGTPTAVVTPDAANGKISIAITNSNTPNATVSNDVYRTDTTNGTPEIRIGTGILPNATFVDYTPATNVVYAYRVRAISAAGGYADVS